MKKLKKEISEKIKLLITFSVMSLMTLIPVLIMVNGISQIYQILLMTIRHYGVLTQEILS